MNNFNEDILGYILRQCKDPIDLIIFQRVCKRWKNSINRYALPFILAKMDPYISKLQNDPFHASEILKCKLKNEPFNPRASPNCELEIFATFGKGIISFDDIFQNGETVSEEISILDPPEYERMKQHYECKLTIAFKRYRKWKYQTCKLCKEGYGNYSDMQDRFIF